MGAPDQAFRYRVVPLAILLMLAGIVFPIAAWVVRVRITWPCGSSRRSTNCFGARLLRLANARIPITGILLASEQFSDLREAAR